MADLAAKREMARERRRKRRDLVHAAGCASRMCIVRIVTFSDPSCVYEALRIGIRIPRSLRRHWGLDG